MLECSFFADMHDPEHKLLWKMYEILYKVFFCIIHEGLVLKKKLALHSASPWHMPPSLLESLREKERIPDL